MVLNVRSQHLEHFIIMSSCYKTRITGILESKHTFNLESSIKSRSFGSIVVRSH